MFLYRLNNMDIKKNIIGDRLDFFIFSNTLSSFEYPIMKKIL